MAEPLLPMVAPIRRRSRSAQHLGTPSLRVRWRRLSVFAKLWTVLCGAVLLNLLVQSVLAVIYVPYTDFLAFDTAGRLLLEHGPRHLYSPELQTQVQGELLGHVGDHGTNAFLNPPPAAFLMVPFSLLPLRLGLALFEVGSLLALAATAAILRQQFLRRVHSPWVAAGLLIPVLCFVPGAESFAFGQWDPLLLLVLTLTIPLIRRGRDVEAGALLTVLLIKPQVVWLVVPMLVAARSWRLIGAFVGGGAMWLATSLALVGEAGCRDLLGYTNNRVDETFKTLGIPGMVAGVTGNLQVPFYAAAGLALGVCALAVLLRQRLQGRPVDALILGVGASLVCAPHVFNDDFLMLVPLVLAAAVQRPLIARIAALGFLGGYAIDHQLPMRYGHVDGLVSLVAVVYAGSTLLREEGPPPERTPRLTTVPAMGAAVPYGAEARHSSP